MSVAVAAAAPEGPALTTDSRTMQQRDEGSSSHYRVASNTADKVFLLRAGSSLGMAMISEFMTRSVIEESPRRWACGRRSTPRRSAASSMSASRRYRAI
jgi:hypothetical protein